MSFFKGTINGLLTLEANDTNTLTWYINVALSVHTDMKVHTGAVLITRKVYIISSSTKQEVNLRTSTELELIVVDEKISKILWMKRLWNGKYSQ